MSDLLLVAGAALGVLSVILAIVALARTRPPRGAAIALVAGIAALAAGAWLDPTPFRIPDIAEAWARLIAGQSRWDMF